MRNRATESTLKAAKALLFLAFVFFIFVAPVQAAPPGPATPLVAPTDPTAVTHHAQCGDAVFGFNANGGGYLCNLTIGGGGNCVAPAYGRGGQTALRDFYHGGRYNPTQAGFLDGAGRPAELADEPATADHGARVVIKPFQMALYSDHVYDFVEHEDLYPDSYPKDGGNSDHDNIDETGPTEADEIGCEFDYQGFEEDATAWTSNRIPALRHVCYYDYIRPPKQILQFGAQGVLDNGNPVLNPKAAVTDISPTALPGPQAPTPVDLAQAILPYSIRLNTTQGFYVAMWQDPQGKWQTHDFRDPKAKPVSMPMAEPQYQDLLAGGAKPGAASAANKAKSPLLLLSTGTDSDQSTALAIYMPLTSPMNRKQFVGIETATGKVAYEEDRRMSLVGQAAYRVRGEEKGAPTRVVNGVKMENDFTLIKILPTFTGMLAPGDAPAGVHERLRMEVFLLIGTPSQIVQAAMDIDARLAE
ncbi:MAG: hypothetical protein NTW86_21130 [Candidatus Sumerlaeota bacterium]|nr:hypothetical protein [Candidatus Sumerlaeota bacterium]